MCYLYVVNHDLRYPHCPRFEASPPPNCNLEPQAVNGLFEGIASTMVLLYAFWSLGVKVSLEQNNIFLFVQLEISSSFSDSSDYLTTSMLL